MILNGSATIHNPALTQNISNAVIILSTLLADLYNNYTIFGINYQVVTCFFLTFCLLTFPNLSKNVTKLLTRLADPFSRIFYGYFGC